MELLKSINKNLGVTIVVITHEMRVIDQICDRVAVIDNSHIAEIGRVSDVFISPKSEIAKELILPQSPLAKKVGKKKVRIIFDGEASERSGLADMILACQVPVNIMFADTKDIDGKAYGHMLLQLPEGENEAQKVISWLAANNMKYTEEA